MDWKPFDVTIVNIKTRHPGSIIVKNATVEQANKNIFSKRWNKTTKKPAFSVDSKNTCQFVIGFCLFSLITELNDITICPV